MIKITSQHEYYSDYMARILGSHCSVSQGLASILTSSLQRTSSQAEAIRLLFFYTVRFGPECYQKLVTRWLQQSGKGLNLLVDPEMFERVTVAYGLLCKELRLMLSSQPIQHNYQLSGGGRRLPMLWKPAIVFPMLFPKDYYGNQWYADWMAYRILYNGRELQEQITQYIGVYMNDKLELDINGYIGNATHGSLVHDYMKTGYQHLIPSPGTLCQECIFSRTMCKKVTKVRPPVSVLLRGIQKDDVQRAIENP